MSRNNSLSMRTKNMAITAQNPSTSSNKGPMGGNSKDISCSTPEPHRAGMSPCNSDSEAASPVPFLCTQDGSYGDSEVVWNYYTPRADREPRSRIAQGTPLSRRDKKFKPKNKIGQLREPKKRPGGESQRVQKTTQLYRDLLELNKNIQGFLERTQTEHDKEVQDRSGSEDDIFNNSGECSPKLDGLMKSGSQCLRRNLLSSKFSRPEPEAALESDDSMNECLMRASQMIEERVFKRHSEEDGGEHGKKYKIEQDSMDAVFGNIKLESSVVKKSTPLINDSFDNFVGNLNDSALERLTQLPIINESPRDNGKNTKGITSYCVDVKPEPSPNSTCVHHGDSTGWTIKELIALDSMPALKSSFGRHNSMPESPSATRAPVSTSTALSRHSSMPWHAHGEKPAGSSSDDSTPLRCTPEEIKRKHQQAREKLLAKRLFPCSGTQESQANPDKDPPSTRTVPKFQPKCSTKSSTSRQLTQKATLPSVRDEEKPKKETNVPTANGSDLKSIIEKKRKEALLKLKMRRSRSNGP